MKRVDDDIDTAVQTVRDFAAEQLAWHSRRGTPRQRRAARCFAARLDRMARLVRRDMSDSTGPVAGPDGGEA